MENHDRIKVAVRHGDGVLQAGLSTIISRCADTELVQLPHGDSDEAVSLFCIERGVSILIADYARALRLANAKRNVAAPASGGKPRMLVLTDRSTHAEIRTALAAGIQGYLLSGCSIPDVIEAVINLNRGVRHLSERAASRLVDGMLDEPLTMRESEVLGHVAAGYPNKVIANQLGVELPTVKVHVAAILEKLGAKNRTEAVAVANQRGLLAALAGGDGATVDVTTMAGYLDKPPPEQDEL